MASDRAEIDTTRAFRSVKEAVTVFGERILVAESRSRYGGTGNAVFVVNPQTDAKHEEESSTITMSSPNAMAEADGVGRAAIVPTYSAPSSLRSFTSSRSPEVDGDDQDVHDNEAGFAVMSSIIKKLEAEVAETRREVVLLRKRGTEMEMAVTSLNAQLRRGLSRLAELDPDKADVTAAMTHSERWASGANSSEYLPSFSHALSLGEIDNNTDLLAYGRKKKAQKVKPMVPLIGDIFFSKSFSNRKNSTTNDSGNLYSVTGC